MGNEEQRLMAVGDIHGRIEALKEVLEMGKFDYEKDKLIILGDVVDGGEDTYEVVEELLKIKHKVFVRGNHDQWFMDWYNIGKELPIWWHQGGLYTAKSYKFNYKNVPESHKELFESSVFYHIEDEMLFVHGGFNPERPIEIQHPETLMWDRTLIEFARKNVIPNFKRVFIGHTTTQFYGSMVPLEFNNLTLLDTGAGWNGTLCLFDITYNIYWISKKQEPSRD